jgi:pimeloyl-ACP methyl ester carboxylesterase
VGDVPSGAGACFVIFIILCTIYFDQTRYWLIGPEKGKKVRSFPPTPSSLLQPPPKQIVLIHGLSIPSIIYKDVAPTLAAHNYRLLLYDLYGRGYSDAPNTVYDTSLYITQLALLMQHVQWEKAGIVGLSMVRFILLFFI